MASGVRISQRDKGFQKLEERLKAMGKPIVRVGILEADGGEPKTEHGGKPSTDGVTLGDVATWMEFGTDTIPARSFLRAYFDENRDRLKEMLRRLTESVVAGKRTKEQALELFAQKVVGEIQARISKGIPPELAPSTIAAKGSSTPLIDTGQLRAGISYEVEE